MIKFEDFQKIELKVAKILEAKKVEGSNKLLKIKVDLGGEQRQIVAGIGKDYPPEDLNGKKIIIVANLKPKVIFGMESQGMLLAAHNKQSEEVVLLVPDKDIKPGSLIS